MRISEIREIPLTDISVENSINVRSDLTSANSIENLEELAESIRTNGLMQPVLLRDVNGHPPYDVIVGKRRFLAHKMLNAATIKAVFTENIDDTEAIILSLSENMLRQEMHPKDIISAITHLYEVLGKDERQVQQRTGLSLRTIRNSIAVEAQTTPELRQMLGKQVSLTNAKRIILAAQGNPDKINALIEPFMKLTNHEKARAVTYGVQNPEASVGDIEKQARKRKVDETMILSLSRKVYAALLKASDDLHLDKEQLIADLLQEWLETNDYIIE